MGPPTLLTLNEGLPQSEVLASRRWKYYKLAVLAGHEAVELRLATIDGQVDLFISECKAASAAQCAERSNRPNETANMFSSIGYEGSDVLNIPRDDPVDVLYVLGVRVKIVEVDGVCILF